MTDEAGEAVAGDWLAVAEAIKERLAERRMTQLELASSANVSLATVQELTRGTARRRYARTLAAMSQALGWPPDHIARLAEGAETGTTGVPSVAAEVKEIRQELARLGRRVDELEARATKQ